MNSNSLNRGLHAAKAAKKDEFYTLYVDIQKEVEAYLEFDPDAFRGKVVYCNCDDPFESNFFKYFALSSTGHRNIRVQFISWRTELQCFSRSLI